MTSSLIKGKPVVRLRAFRAVDDPETCKLFLQGHRHVLTAIGVNRVSSSKNEWMENPAAFALIVESLDKTKVFGGARIHVAGGSELLPIEQATGSMDSNIFRLVYAYAQRGTGEICGLWNSREIAGFGIGSIFLTRAAVAIATQIGLSSLFALCASYTVSMAEHVGYRVEARVGDKGTFYYPKQDLVATSMLHEHLQGLETARAEEREAIFALRNRPDSVRSEQLRGKSVEIHYRLEIPHLDRWDLAATIANASENFPDDQNDSITLNLF